MTQLQPSRRTFLRRAALAGAGAWASAAGSACQGRWPSDRLNIGVIGVDGRGAVNLDCIKTENVVALCDVDAGRLARASETFPKAYTYADFREMLGWDEIDAVVVTTPDHTHAPASAMALRKGKHVYCEKPLTHSVHEARVIAGLAAEAGVATQMGTQMHGNYRPAVEKLREGVIGPIREVHAWTDRPVWEIPKAKMKFNPPAPEHLDWDLWLGPAADRPYQMGLHPFGWRAWWDFGTGAVGDAACHVLDPAFWALELGLPSSVEAEGSPVHPEITPSWSIVRSEFPARGDLPLVMLSWYEAKRRPPEEVTEGLELPPQGLIFLGESGKMMVTHLSGDHVLVTDEGAESFALEDPLAADDPDHQLEWIAACKAGTPTSCDFARSAVLTEAVLLGNVAYRLGRRIEWDADAMKVVGCPEAAPYLRREYREGWTL